MKYSQSIKEIQSDLLNNKYSCRSLVEFYISNANEHKNLNAYIQLYETESLEKADQIDRKIQNGDNLGKLFGAVLSIKDNICYSDHISSAGSKMLDEYSSPYTATPLKRLIDEGLIVIGRTNCDEFGMGSSNENSSYGPTKNKFNPRKVPGGSSGGAAVSVQIDSCTAAMGSDTGGSIRQPAAFCGLFGTKPTYGRISRYGLIAYASSFDQIGFITRNTCDAQLLSEIASGKDSKDHTTSSNQYDKSEITNKDLKFLFLKHPLEGKISPEVKTSIDSALQNISNHLKIDVLDFPFFDYVVPAYYVMTTAEASSNLSRYDGVRYGHRSEKKGTPIEFIKNNRTEGFGLEVKRRIMLGSFVLSAGYAEAYYGKAQRIRRVLIDKVSELLEDYDGIILPTSPSKAWDIGSKLSPVELYLSDVFTVLANITGLPCVSIPVESTESQVSLQLMDRPFAENVMLEKASIIHKLIHSI